MTSAGVGVGAKAKGINPQSQQVMSWMAISDISMRVEKMQIHEIGLSYITITTVYAEIFTRRKFSPISPMHAVGESDFFAR